MDNANTITDMAKTQNSVYEIVSDVNSRQDIIEERLTCLEEKLNNIQISLELLPDMLSRVLQSQPQMSQAPAQATLQETQEQDTDAVKHKPCPGPDQLQISSSKSCPPGPWLPSTSSAVSVASSSNKVTATGSKQLDVNPGHMSSSYSVSQRLSNQFSVDSTGSGHGHISISRLPAPVSSYDGGPTPYHDTQVSATAPYQNNNHS